MQNNVTNFRGDMRVFDEREWLRGVPYVKRVVHDVMDDFVRKAFDSEVRDTIAFTGGGSMISVCGDQFGREGLQDFSKFSHLSDAKPCNGRVVAPHIGGNTA